MTKAQRIQIVPFSKSQISAGLNNLCLRIPINLAMGRVKSAQTASTYRIGKKVYINKNESAHCRNPYIMNFSNSRGIFIKEYIFSRRAS